MKKNIYLIVFSFLFSIVIWGSISLSDEFYTNLTLPVEIVDVPDGFTAGAPNPQKVDLKLKAKGWQLITLNLASHNFRVSANQDSGSFNEDFNNNISQNNWLSSGFTVMDVIPGRVKFLVEKVYPKKLRIMPDLDLSFRPGYGLAKDITVIPDSVVVYGPRSVLANIDYYKTQNFSLKNLDNPVSINVNLAEVPGFVVSQKNVQLNLDIQRIVEKPFDNVKVSVLDLPSDRDVVLIPNQITCSIRGGINILGKLKNSDIIATVNYRDVLLDTLGNIEPQIKLPANTELVFTKPSVLRYVIKKFE